MAENDSAAKRPVDSVYGRWKRQNDGRPRTVYSGRRYNWNICLIQFVKGTWKYGELKGIKKLEPNVELYTVGEGFVE